MKKNIFYITSIISLGSTAQHAMSAGIVPECTDTICTLCDIWKLASNIINFFLIDLAVPVLTVMILWGGVMWVTAGASPSNIEQGKKIITNSIIGILIAFAGWLIVDTVIKSLADPAGNLVGAWQDFPACSLATPEQLPSLVAPPFVPPAPVQVTDYTDRDQTAAEANEAAVRAQLATAGVGVNKAACNPYNIDGIANGCTNVGGLKPQVIQEIIEIKRLSGASITITGGSEFGHSCGAGHPSHCTGNKFDLRPNPALDAYLQGFIPAGTRSGDGARLWRKDARGSVIYAKEGDHWDILVQDGI